LHFWRRTSFNLLAAFFFLAGFLTAMNSPPSFALGPRCRTAQLALELRARHHAHKAAVGDEQPKLPGDPRASAMQERAAVADICPNAAAHEHQRNGQSKENVHFKNSTLDSQTAFA
jgi:hypothetical protein